MVKGKRNPQPNKKRKKSKKAVCEQLNEPGDDLSKAESLNTPIYCGSNIVYGTSQTDPFPKVDMQTKERAITQNVASTVQFTPSAKYCDSSSPSLKPFANDLEQETLPVNLLQGSITTNYRSKTPDNPINPEEIFSPNTIHQFRSTVRALFPNGPPPLPPIMPMKRHKKGDTPYIVGCTKRRRVPESNSLNFFKGDDYGITSETNGNNNDDEYTLNKRRRTTCTGNWSKSIFNPKSEEIAARLKLNERVDELLRKSPSKETVPFMSNAYLSKPQTFSPLPSTSKDSETILKNEKHFNETLNYNNNYDLSDDEELPAILWNSNGKGKIQTHVSSSLRNKYLETISEPIIKDEDVNNNNNLQIDNFEETGFCGVLLNKKNTIRRIPSTADETIINLEDVTENVEPTSNHNSATDPVATTGLVPSTVDQTVKNLEHVTENLAPKSNHNNDPVRVSDALELKDDNTDIIFENLYSVPQTEEVIDIDEVIAELNAFTKSRAINGKSIVTVVNSVGSSENNNNTVDLVTTQTPLNKIKTKGALNEASTSSTIIEVPDLIEPVLDVSNYVSPNKANPTIWNEDVEFISETSPDKNTNRTRINELGLRNNNNITTGFNNNDVEIVQNDFANSHSDLHTLLEILAASCSDYMAPKRRKRKSYITKRQRSNNLPVTERIVAHENNENAAPPTSGPTKALPSLNGELGDCPICMDSLSKSSLASTTCGHVFCVECIKKCLKTSGKRCPTCRKILKGNGYHQVFL